MDAARQTFNKKERNLIKFHFVFLTINTLLICVRLGLLLTQNLATFFEISSVIAIVWYGILLVYSLISFSCLMINTRFHYFYCFNTHKWGFVVMQLALIFMTVSSMSLNVGCFNEGVKYFARFESFFLYSIMNTPVFVFLFTYKAEDCIGCFNKFTSRYSRFQYPKKAIKRRNLRFSTFRTLTSQQMKQEERRNSNFMNEQQQGGRLVQKSLSYKTDRYSEAMLAT